MCCMRPMPGSAVKCWVMTLRGRQVGYRYQGLKVGHAEHAARFHDLVERDERGLEVLDRLEPSTPMRA